MKIKYLKLKNWLLVTLGGLLGINLVGCEKIFNTACEYGTPEATYHVLGTVTNADGQPIPGIGVGRYNPWDEEADTLMSARYHDTTDAIVLHTVGGSPVKILMLASMIPTAPRMATTKTQS